MKPSNLVALVAIVLFLAVFAGAIMATEPRPVQVDSIRFDAPLTDQSAPEMAVITPNTTTSYR